MTIKRLSTYARDDVANDWFDRWDVVHGELASQTPVTDLVKVNTTLPGAQFAPAVAALSGGGYVIVWEDSSAGRIYGQRFSAAGEKVGSELQLDSTQGGSPVWVSVAATANDGFVIAFQAGSFAQAEIFARHYDGANTPVGGLFAVNTTSPNEQFNPHITALDNGALLFTWDTQAFDVFQEVRGRIFLSNGQALGNDFVIAPMSANAQHGLSAIAPLAGGSFVVTWQSATGGSSNFEIVGQRFSSNGTAIGSPFTVNTQTTNNQFGNDVARLSDGGFVVTWADPVPPGNLGGRIVARHYDASGVAIGGEIVIDSKGAGNYGSTVVTALANGGYVVSWTEDDGTSAQNNVLAREMGANDQPVGAVFEISFNSPFGANLFTDGAVTLPNGNVVFTWDGPSVGTNTGQDIYTRLYDFSTASNVPTEGDDILTDTSGNDAINALGGNDRITLTNGRDTVNGGAGTDTLVLDWGLATTGVGTDTFEIDPSGGLRGIYSEGAVQISGRLVSFGQVERFIITTGLGADNIVTGSGDDEVRTGAGDDRVNVGGGVNIADGGADVDAISADLSALDTGVTIDLNNAANSGGYGSFSNFEYFGALTGTGFEDVFVTTGLARNDLINAGAGADRITIVNGTDTVNAGAGSDTLVIDWSTTTQAVTNFQTPTANPNGGFDGRFYAGVINFPDRDVSYTQVERFEITTGTANDSITTAAGDDILNGGAGADTLTGAAGNDLYLVDDAGDVVIELAGGGTDSIEVSISYSIETLVHVENLLGAATGQSLTGNDGANRIEGRGGNDTLTGLAGSDLIDGGDGDDVIDGGAGYDDLRGRDGNDRLIGGADVANDLNGGTGNDVYVVSNAGDTLYEAANAGTDTIETALSVYAQHALNIERLTGTSNAGQYLIGNSEINEFRGGAGNDIFQGGLGNDVYFITNAGDSIVEGANEGAFDVVFSMLSSYVLTAANVEVLVAVLDGSTIVGNSGDNFLRGDGAGAYTFVGGLGNDDYEVRNGTETIFEAAGEGIDTVRTGLQAYALAETSVENLIGNRNSAQTLIGNSLGNRIQGSVAGTDTLIGGQGDDVYVLGEGIFFSVDDTVIELAGQGTDTVETSGNFYQLGANVENLTFTGGAAYGSGNSLDNVLRGGDSNDTLRGGLGSDTLIGGAGSDGYIFDTVLGASNIDLLSDFASGSDRILLDNLAFTALAEGSVSASAFVVGTAAIDADDRLIYNSATGALFYDADGSGAGAAVQFATLGTGLSLLASDFSVI